MPSTSRTDPEIAIPNSKLGILLWALPFLLAGFCFWKALPTGERPATSTAIAAIAAPVAGTEAAPIQRTVLTRAIQETRLGQRVLAEKPGLEGLEVPDTEIDPAARQTVRLSMDKPDGCKGSAYRKWPVCKRRSGRGCTSARTTEVLGNYSSDTHPLGRLKDGRQQPKGRTRSVRKDAYRRGLRYSVR